MSSLKPGFKIEKLVSLLSGYGFPKSYIETGTYRGESAAVAAGSFQKVKTIELSERWYNFSKEKLSIYLHVQCYWGDSMKVLPTLIKGSPEPTYFFLDAHFAGGTTAMGPKEVPIMEELAAILGRDENDIIVIDDLRLVGKKGQTGEKDHELYPLMEFDWEDISLEWIKEQLGSNSYTTFEYMDRLYAYRHVNFLQAILIGFLFNLMDWRRFVRKLRRVSR